MREKLDNKIPSTDIKQKRIKLEIYKPRGYTLKTIDVSINDFITPIKLEIDKPRGYTLKTIDPGIHNYVPQKKRSYTFV